MVETALPGLSLMPSGPYPQRGSIAQRRQFATMLKDVSKTFDIVIIDGPPVLGLADTPRLAAVARKHYLHRRGQSRSDRQRRRRGSPPGHAMPTSSAPF